MTRHIHDRGPRLKKLVGSSSLIATFACCIFLLVPTYAAGQETGAERRGPVALKAYQVKPQYPESAQKKGVQGTTVLKVLVLLDGSVGKVLVDKSAGHPDLDQAAAEAAQRWRFEPARRGKEPIAIWVLIPVKFELAERYK